MSEHEKFADAFVAIVDGVRLDIPYLRSEWRERTAYGQARLALLLAVYPRRSTIALDLLSVQRTAASEQSHQH